MTNQPIVVLMSFYGLFLILCGLASLTFIGIKAKTAVASGGMSGLFSFLIAHLSYRGAPGAILLGLLLSLLLFIVFSWRLSKTLFTIFKLIPSSHQDLQGKGIAFLIIGLMAVVSMMVFILLLLLYCMVSL